MTTRDEIEKHLKHHLSSLEMAEEHLLAATLKYERAKLATLRAEDAALLAGAADGKNAEIRSAQVRAATIVQASNESMERAVMLTSDSELRTARASLSVWLALAQLNGGID